MELENRGHYDVENSLAEQKLEKLKRLRELQAEISKLSIGAAAYYNDPVGFARDCIHWGDRELTPYQGMVLDMLRDNRRVAIRAPRGTGKALALDTPLPTPTGWTTMGEVQVGDDLLDETGRICKVTGKSPAWSGDTYEVEFADKTVITTHGNHEWNAIDIYNRPKGVRDWRETWSATRRITTAQMCRTLRTSARGDARWHIPTAEPLRLPEADLPIDPYLFGYWLGDGSSGTNRITVNIKDWPNLEQQIRRAGYFHRVSVKPGIDNLTVTISHSPIGEGRCKNGNASMRTVLRDIGVLGNKSIPMMYKRASIEQRRELIRGLWDSDGFRGHGDDEITLTNKALFDDVIEVLHSLGLVVRTSERDAKLSGRVVGRQWRAAARFDFNPYRLERYDWKPRGSQSSRHTQRTVIDVRRVDDQLTQCIEVDSPSHLFLAGHSMVPTHNSATSAITVLWFAVTREAACVDWKAVTTAGSWNQLTNYLWPEIKKWAGKLKWDLVRDGKPFGQLELQNLSLRLRYGSAFAAASSNPSLIEGAHADSLLVLFDESKAIPAETFDAIEGAFTGTGEIFTLAVSTPGAPQGRFYDIHTDRVRFRDWTARHITLEETLAAGQISKEWVEQRRVQWGEYSALYQNHVLGEFYAGEEDSVIPLSWVEAAVERWREWDANGREDMGKPHTVGVDIARSGTDKTVLALRQANVITELRAFTINDTMATTGRVKSVLDNDENCTAIVDVIGIGAGVVDRLREQNARVQAFNAAGRSNKRDKTNEIGFLNCLVEDARVFPVGKLLRVYRGRYEGSLYRIKMASGDEFTTTENHKVLTFDGWTPVHSLNVGDNLPHAGFGNSVPLGSGPDSEGAPPTIGEIYCAAAQLFGPKRVVGSLVNFHGDRPAGDVDVVSIDGELLGSFDTSGEHSKNVKLVRLLHGLGDLPSEGSFNKAGMIGHTDGRINTDFPLTGEPTSTGSPLIRGESGGSEPIGLSAPANVDLVVSENPFDEIFRNNKGTCERFDRISGQVPVNDSGVIEIRPDSKQRGLGTAPLLDALLIKQTSDNISIDSEEFAECMQGLAGLVSGNEIISIDVIDSTGHDPSYVYTLETSTGVYSTSSVAHRNCRAAAWWNLRELLDPSAGSDICLPPEDDMLGDLTAPRMGELMSGGKMKLESKEDLRKRIGRSTDFGDAVVQAFWTPIGNWHEAYGTAHCGNCNRGFLQVADGKRRTSCPFCSTPIADEFDIEQRI